MIKLKKCPFCGCKKVEIRIEAKWMMEHVAVADPLIKAEVSCRDCLASVFAFACRRGSPFAVAKDEGEPTEAAILRAAEKWNRRGGREPANL